MKQIYKIIMSVFIILTLVGTVMALENTNQSLVKESNVISHSQNDVPNIELSYTNPINGILTSQSRLYAYVETDQEVLWDSYTFYLSNPSYVNINIDGTIGSITDSGYTSEMYLDNMKIASTGNFQWCDEYFGQCQPLYATKHTEYIHMSYLKYLSKGSHTISINGSAFPYTLYRGCTGGYQCYYVDGTISVIGFPEYTALTVIYPNGGETWYRGQTKSITWKKDGQPGANVKIELYKAGVLKTVISSSTPNDGAHSWYIPTSLTTGTDYKIKITSTTNTVYNDWSNSNFRIY